jgi:hypothetical protein
MTALSTVQPIRPERMVATTFDAFRICEGGRTYPLGKVGAATLDEALAAVLTGSQVILHKEHVLIREDGPRGVRMHLFAVKRQAAPVYVWRDHVQVREHRLYAAPVCQFDAGVIA